MADLDPQSILARSQAQTEASLRNVKKLNRQAWVVSGLSAYDQVRRQQAIERANRVYSEGSRYLQQQERFLSNLTNFWSNHETQYSTDPVNWQPVFWNNKVNSFLTTSGLEQNEENKERWNSIFREDPLAQREFEEYQRLYNLYSNVDFDRRSIAGESNESYEARQAAWTQSERKRLLDLRNRISRQGGLWHDVKNALGLNTGSEEIAFTPDYTFQIPSDVADSTRELLESIFHRKEMIDAIDQQTGAYDAVRGDSIIARTMRARTPDERTLPFRLSESVFEGESEMTDFLSNAFTYVPGPIINRGDFPSNTLPGLQSIKVESGGEVVALDDFVNLYEKYVNEEGEEVWSRSSFNLSNVFDIANASENLREQPEAPNLALDNLRDRMLVTKFYLQTSANIAAEVYDRQDLADMFINISEDNTQLMKIIFESDDFRDILGISKIGETGSGISDSPNFVRVQPSIATGTNQLILNRINNLTLSGPRGFSVVDSIVNTSPVTLTFTGNPDIDRIAQQIYASVLARSSN